MESRSIAVRTSEHDSALSPRSVLNFSPRKSKQLSYHPHTTDRGSSRFLVFVVEELSDRGHLVCGEFSVITDSDHIGAKAYEFIHAADLHLAALLTHFKDKGDQGSEGGAGHEPDVLEVEHEFLGKLGLDQQGELMAKLARVQWVGDRVAQELDNHELGIVVVDYLEGNMSVSVNGLGRGLLMES
jgi:hypothetical protein